MMEWERVSTARDHYLYLYSRHRPFVEALDAFYREVCEPLQNEVADDISLIRLVINSHQYHREYCWVGRYVASVRELCGQFGLDMFGDPPQNLAHRNYVPAEAEEMLHRWCSMKATMRIRGLDFPAKYFLTAAGGGGGWTPDIEDPEKPPRVMI